MRVCKMYKWWENNSKVEQNFIHLFGVHVIEELFKSNIIIMSVCISRLLIISTCILNGAFPFCFIISSFSACCSFSLSFARSLTCPSSLVWKAKLFQMNLLPSEEQKVSWIIRFGGLRYSLHGSLTWTHFGLMCLIWLRMKFWSISPSN